VGTKKKDATRTTNMPEAIASEMRELITRGTLSPGLQLKQIELAKRFGSSRVPLREAFKLLTTEGIVEHDPNRGFFVASLSSEEARQLYRIRHLLEGELFTTLQWPSREQLESLRKQLDKLENLLQKQDSAGWVVQHRLFYQAIYDLSPEKIIVREVLRYIRLTDRYRSLAAHVLLAPDRKANQERHLLEALAERNRRRLMRVFEEDRTRIEQGVMDALRVRGL
jgi:DNA-binding GntR family transcriptional regulator